MSFTKAQIKAFITSGLGKDITVTTSSGTHQTRGIMVEPTLEDTFGDIGITGHAPAIHIDFKDIERYAIDEGDTLKVEGLSQVYQIRDIEPDGEGFAELKLRNNV